jgi:predicted membrane-bound dolichyl-phosphate-mannose-protein mannosyltransferase
MDLMMHTSSNKRPTFFIIVASIFIVLVNSLIKTTITSLVAAERHKTRVNETTTYMNKSVLAQFISSCLSLFLVDQLLGSHNNLHFYANTFIAISSVIELLYQLVHPSWVAKSLRKWWRYRNMNP